MGVNFVLLLILVRLIPAEIYASIVLTKVSLIVVTSLGGMGLSQAAVRWVNLKEREDLVLGTVLLGTLVMAIPATLVLLALFAVFESRVDLTLTPDLIAVVAVLVFSFMLNNELINWARARHKSVQHAILSLVRALLQLGAIIVAVKWTFEARGYLYGLAFAEIVLLITVFLVDSKSRFVSSKYRLLTVMLRYGWPHTLVIASGFLLTYVDRYMLSFLVEDAAVVAYYDAAYMIVASVLALLVRPFNLMLFPTYTRKYAEEGGESTALMLNRVQYIFLIAGFAVASIVVVIRVPLTELLLPEDYVATSSIFAAVAYGAILNGVFISAVAGLYISQKTLMVGIAAIAALVANIVANFLLIPPLGVDGAALGTAIASAVQLGVGYWFSTQVLPVKLPVWLLAFGGLWIALLHFIST